MAYSKVLGVQFSGAALAGSRTWVCEGTIDGGRVTVAACRQVADLPGGAVERDPSVVALRSYLAKQRAALIGLVFPFGLPAALVGDKRWLDFVKNFGSRFDSVEDLTEQGRKAAGGQERWRVTDRELGRRSGPHKRRLAFQTFYGIRDVLAPLVCDGKAAAVPMQAPLPRKPVLLEVAPTSTLRKARIAPPFKGAAPLARGAREGVLRELESRGWLTRMDPELEARVLDDAEGDALAAVVAAVTAAQAGLRPERWEVAADHPYRIEGRIFAD